MNPAHNSSYRAPVPRRAFTLIELLVVIAIMAILAGLIFPVTKIVNRQKIRSKARAELIMLETAIESYKTKLGHYPPDNPNPLSRFINPLYFELSGTTNTSAGGQLIYGTLDRSAWIQGAQVQTTFGIAGFVNTMAGAGGSEEGRTAINFVPGIKSSQSGELPTLTGARIIVSSILRQDQSFRIVGTTTLNPFFYNSSSPTNNANSFDLWVDVIVDGKTNRICNWSKEPLILNGPE